MQVLENAAEGGGAGRGPRPAPLRVRRQRQMLPEHPVPLAHRFPGVAAASRRQLRRARGWDTGGRAPCGNTATRTPHSQRTQPRATTRGWGRPLPTPAPNQPGDKNGYSQGRAGPWPPALAPTGSRCVGAGLEPAPSLSARTPPPPLTHRAPTPSSRAQPTTHRPEGGVDALPPLAAPLPTSRAPSPAESADSHRRNDLGAIPHRRVTQRQDGSGGGSGGLPPPTRVVAPSSASGY